MIKNKFTIILFTLMSLFGLFSCKSKSDLLLESTCVDSPDTREVVDLEKVYVRDESWYKDFRVITFGKFEQDGDVKNGKEDISWIILDDNGSERLLISKDVIYAMPFDDNVDQDVNVFNQDWEKSSLRKWLNEDFFDVAFNEDEKQYVVSCLVNNKQVFGINNSDEISKMGDDTFDKVYILSKDEIRKYLGFENEGRSEEYLAKPSNYAKEILAAEKEKENIAVWHKEIDYEDIYEDNAEYWVRSSIGLTLMSANEYFTDIVDKRGHISSHGLPYYVFKSDKNDNSTKHRFYNRGVRPVIRIAGSAILDEEQRDGIREEKKAQIYDIKEIDKPYVIANYDKEKNFKDFDSVVLGSYEQDGDTTNGKEGIEWLVLKKENNKALLFSKYILDYVEYSNILERYTVWKDSRLRAWANHEFYDSSFSEKEKVLISSTRVKNYDNPVYVGTSGQSTIDKVFVPGFDELMETFNIDYDDCIREPFYDQKIIEDKRLLTTYTDFALKKYRKEKNNNKAMPQPDFWLRNQGRSGEGLNSRSNNAMLARQTIDFKGTPYDLFQYSNNSDKVISTNPKLGFRPCILVDINILNEFDGTSYDSKTDKIFSEEIPQSNRYSFEEIENARVVSSYNNKATFESFDTVTFGTYEQDGESNNGKEEIEWIVLDKRGNEYLLLSKYVLDHHQFQSNKVDGLSISWNNSEIRMWANTEFLNDAFSETEQKYVMQSSVENTINDYYNLRPTEDRIFLLSIDEIIKYFGSKNANYDGVKINNYINVNDKSRTYATSFARNRGVIIGAKNEISSYGKVYACGYYTRSMRNSNYNQVSYINDIGSDGFTSVYDTWKRFGFRPAVWVTK